MTTAKVFKIENRLAKVVRLPGGRTVAEAVRAADTRVDRLKDRCLATLLARITELAGLAAGGREGQADALDRIYAAADEIIGVGGAAKLEAVVAAAYSLCELADCFRIAGTANWPAVEVHVDSLRLLADEALPAEERSRILGGLKRVSERFTAP